MDELLEVIEYSFVDHYKNKTRFGLLQYFSLTDIMPIPLSKIALSKGKRSLARFLNKFDDQNYWNLNELDLEKNIRLLHSVRGHVVTQQEKLNVVEKLKEEAFPLLEGTLMEGSRYYVCKGLAAISKKKKKKELLDSYNMYYENRQPSENSNPYVLVKQRERK